MINNLYPARTYQSGGGMLVTTYGSNRATATISGGTISGNEATNVNGGGVHKSAGNGTLDYSKTGVSITSNTPNNES